MNTINELKQVSIVDYLQQSSDDPQNNLLQLYLVVLRVSVWQLSQQPQPIYLEYPYGVSYLLNGIDNLPVNMFTHLI